MGKLEDFIAIRVMKEENEAGSFNYKFENGIELEVKKLSAKQVLDIISKADDDTRAIDVFDSLIYAAIPELHTAEVLEQFNCTNNPEAVVKEIFSYADRVTIGKDLRDTVEKITVEKVKN